MHPEMFVDFRRFDIPAKTLYAAHRLGLVGSSFPEELYREHLRVWNGFDETDPPKTGFDAYRQAFDSMLDAVQTGAFDFASHPVRVAPGGQLYDGAHRVSAAWVHGREIATQPADRDPFDHYDYRFFLNRRQFVPGALAQVYADAMALEYLRLKGDKLNVAVFWPAANGLLEESEDVLRRHAGIYYAKFIQDTAVNADNVVRRLYALELWVDTVVAVVAKVGGASRTAAI